MKHIKTAAAKTLLLSLSKKMELGNPAFMRVSGLLRCGLSTD